MPELNPTYVKVSILVVLVLVEHVAGRTIVRTHNRIDEYIERNKEVVNLSSFNNEQLVRRYESNRIMQRKNEDREESKRFLGSRKNCVERKVPKCYEQKVGKKKVTWCVLIKKRECSSLD